MELLSQDKEHFDYKDPSDEEIMQMEADVSPFSQ